MTLSKSEWRVHVDGYDICNYGYSTKYSAKSYSTRLYEVTVDPFAFGSGRLSRASKYITTHITLEHEDVLYLHIFCRKLLARKLHRPMPSEREHNSARFRDTATRSPLPSIIKARRFDYIWSCVPVRVLQRKPQTVGDPTPPPGRVPTIALLQWRDCGIAGGLRRLGGLDWMYF